MHPRSDTWPFLALYIAVFACLMWMPPPFSDDLWLFQRGILLAAGCLALACTLIFDGKDTESSGTVYVHRNFLLWSGTFTILALISCFWSINSFLALRQSISHIATFLIIIWLTCMLRNREYLYRSVYILVFAALISAFTGVIFYIWPEMSAELIYTSENWGSNRPGALAGMHYNKNFHASFLAMILPWILFLPNRSAVGQNELSGWISHGWLKLVAIALFLPVIGTSLGALAGTCAAAIAVCIAMKPQYRRPVIGITALFVMLVMLLWFLDLPAGFWTLSARQHRMSFWKTSIAMLKEFPILGAGMEQYQIYSGKYHVSSGGEGLLPSMFAHNEYVQLTGELGIAGALLAVLVIRWIILLVSGSEKPEYARLAGQCSLTVFAVHSFVSYPWHMPLSLGMAIFSAAAILSTITRNSGAFIKFSLKPSGIMVAVFVLLIGLICLVEPVAAALNARARYLESRYRGSNLTMDKAGPLYSLSLLFRPDDPVAANRMAEIFMALNLHHEAVRVYEQALRYNPWRSALLFNMGNALASLDRYEEAVISYEKAVRLSSRAEERGRMYFNLGHGYQELELYQKSQKAYENAVHEWISISRYREAGEAKANLGILLARTGHRPEAFMALADALELYPAQPEIIRIYEALGRDIAQDASK